MEHLKILAITHLELFLAKLPLKDLRILRTTCPELSPTTPLMHLKILRMTYREISPATPLMYLKILKMTYPVFYANPRKLVRKYKMIYHGLLATFAMEMLEVAS